MQQGDYSHKCQWIHQLYDQLDQHPTQFQELETFIEERPEQQKSVLEYRQMAVHRLPLVPHIRMGSLLAHAPGSISLRSKSAAASGFSGSVVVFSFILGSGFTSSLSSCQYFLLIRYSGFLPLGASTSSISRVNSSTKAV